MSHRLKFSREREGLSQSFSLTELTQVGYLLGNQSLDLEGFGGLLSREGALPKAHSFRVGGGSQRGLRVPLIKEGGRDAGQLSPQDSLCRN